jgi:acyl carrier protein
MSDERFEKMKDLMAEMLDISRNEITDEAAFISDLGADSLDVVELAMAVEETFGIKIPVEDYRKLETVGDVRAYLTPSSA